jgi:hypothetical protein
VAAEVLLVGRAELGEKVARPNRSSDVSPPTQRSSEDSFPANQLGSPTRQPSVCDIPSRSVAPERRASVAEYDAMQPPAVPEIVVAESARFDSSQQK